MGFFLFVRQATKNLDLDNSNYVGAIRSLYLGSQLIVIILSFYLMSVIRKKNGNWKFQDEYIMSITNWNS